MVLNLWHQWVEPIHKNTHIKHHMKPKTWMCELPHNSKTALSMTESVETTELHFNVKSGDTLHILSDQKIQVYQKLEVLCFPQCEL